MSNEISNQKQREERPIMTVKDKRFIYSMPQEFEYMQYSDADPGL